MEEFRRKDTILNDKLPLFSTFFAFIPYTTNCTSNGYTLQGDKMP